MPDSLAIVTGASRGIGRATAIRLARDRESYPEVGRISNFVSFELDIVSVQLDGRQLRLDPGQTVIPHGPDRDLTVAEACARR